VFITTPPPPPPPPPPHADALLRIFYGQGS
jgi:hypothetical protein